jgi:hypothetical protein
MADELTLKVTFNYNPSTAGEVTVAPAEFNGTFDVSGSALISGIQEIGTSEETLTLGDVSTLGYLMIKNLDSTNFIQYNVDATPTQYTGKLKAGEFALVRLGDTASALYLKADTAACDIQYWLLSD